MKLSTGLVLTDQAGCFFLMAARFFLMAANGPNLPIQPIEFYQLAASSLRLLAR
jgi:hypothetical protein